MNYSTGKDCFYPNIYFTQFKDFFPGVLKSFSILARILSCSSCRYVSSVFSVSNGGRSPKTSDSEQVTRMPCWGPTLRRVGLQMWHAECLIMGESLGTWPAVVFRLGSSAHIGTIF